MAKVLVIENEPAILANLTRMLRLEGFEAVGVADGVSGVAAARNDKPDVVLCDLLMPAMNGDAVLAALRSDGATAATPFIFLTASADKSEREARLRGGANDYLVKPVDFKELLAAIRRQLLGDPSHG
jgi:DNA-binding response OmpR family regulator